MRKIFGIWLMFMLFSCSTGVTKEKAKKIVEQVNSDPQHQPIPEFTLILNNITNEIIVNGKRSGRLGSCIDVFGVRDVTIYLNRIKDENQFKNVYLHELYHAKMTCSNADHENNCDTDFCKIRNQSF